MAIAPGGIPVVLGTLILEPFSVLSGVSLRAALATAFMVLVCGILGTWAWFRVVQLFPAGVAAIGTLAVPVVGVLSSAVILGEPIGIREIVALLLLVPLCRPSC
jgi:drug/metabolite transporter (DMT)-like permease